MTGRARAVVIVAASSIAAACGLGDAAAPVPSGPSELGLSLQVTVWPDALPADGVSTSVVTVFARDANARPVARLVLRADLIPGDDMGDMPAGALSSRTVRTAADGRASLEYLAPRLEDALDHTITVRLTPVGRDASSDVGRTAQIRLVPPDDTLAGCALASRPCLLRRLPIGQGASTG